MSFMKFRAEICDGLLRQMRRLDNSIEDEFKKIGTHGTHVYTEVYAVGSQLVTDNPRPMDGLTALQETRSPPLRDWSSHWTTDDSCWSRPASACKAPQRIPDS